MNFSVHALVSSLAIRFVQAAFGQGQEIDYLANFNAINSATYSVIKDSPNSLPPDLLAVCSNIGAVASSGEVVVQADASGIVDSATVSAQCGNDSVCIIPLGTTFQFDDDIDLGALIVRGAVEWNDVTAQSNLNDGMYLCAGYVAVEGHGKWEMDLQNKDAFIYIKDNGFSHGHLRSRAFGSHAMLASDYPIIDINGRELKRTWSVLSNPLQPGENKVKLMHDANLMGWRVGDRIGISPTQPRAAGIGEEFTIAAIDSKGVITLDETAQYQHSATFVAPQQANQSPALMSAEVVNLSRNIVITGDDFKHVPCDPNLSEAVGGEQTSTEGCRCASFRSQCTVGLHTAVMHGGTAKIQNVRVERCGQRGVEGKYCLHFHKLHDCPTCLFKNNAIEGSHQRGIIVHGTHSSTVEDNVLYNVRGAGIYIEDGNEMYNDIKYNVVLCPNPFQDTILHGCTVPGTSNAFADTSDNQSGIFSRAVTNNLIGNRVANAFNGMFFKAGGTGRGESAGQVCEADAKLARVEGNTWHGNGRFGTYTLGSNYAKETDQSILNNGHNLDQSLCSGFDSQGYGRGAPGSMVDNLDYNNAFVGHYNAGDIQHNGHHSYSNLNLIYWKETKNFDNGCSSHLFGGSYADGQMALPDQGTFIIEDTTFGDGVVLEANHHCNVGITGVLCFPQYLLHNIQWKNSATTRWMYFQNGNTQGHSANQNHGGIFSLSPPNAQVVMDGGLLHNNFFPPGYVSLVSSNFNYLLSLPGEPCNLSTTYGDRYGGGILCTIPLRSLKIYSSGLLSGSAPAMQVEMWHNRPADSSPADSSQVIPFHQIGGDLQTQKQGYSLPIIPGAEHAYRLSLLDGNGDIPSNWVVEFSDHVIGNRWAIEYTNLFLNGYACGSSGLISSHHDRRYMWSGDEFMKSEAWGSTGACAVAQPQDSPLIDCSSINVLPAAECPEMCSNTCDEITSYCDCSGTCKLKPGFTETSDLSAAARCTEHGHPSAKYLGGNLPVTSNACLCDNGWSGSLCQFNPCEAQNKTCGAHGTCVALSDTEAKCECDLSWSGESCETSCEGLCTGGGGAYPFGCNPSLGESIVRYGCSSTGGCRYLSEGEQFPGGEWCAFKEVGQESTCLCGGENDCEITVSCNLDGSCPPPQYLPDSSPCNSVPFGVCQIGTCLEEGTTAGPTRNPTSSPSSKPTMALPSKTPTSEPTLVPTAKPTTPTSIFVTHLANPPNDPSAPTGTYFSFAEADWEALFGPMCQFDPCQAQNVACGDHGTCVAISETEAKCSCDQGWSGDACETTCDGQCPGSWPYGCNPNLVGVVEYGCLSGGGCNYLTEGQEYPYAGFCTFKEVVQEFDCVGSGSIFTVNQLRGGEIIWTGEVKIWPASGEISAHGRREPSVAGVFQDGDQMKPLSLTSGPTKSPTWIPSKAPTDLPTTQPSNNPTSSPSKGPTNQPTGSPTKEPTSSPTKETTGSPTKEPTGIPTKEPTNSPSKEPTGSPTKEPSLSPSKSPTKQPSDSPSSSPSKSPTQKPSPPPTNTPTNNPSIEKFFCASGTLDEETFCDETQYPSWNSDCNFNCNGKNKICQSVVCSSGPNPPSGTSQPTAPGTPGPTLSPTQPSGGPPAECVGCNFSDRKICNNCGGGGFCTWSGSGKVCNTQQ